MLKWSNIDVVMLDMDGTLLDLNFDNYFWQTLLPERYGEMHGLEFDEAKRQLMARFSENAGTLEWYCLDYWQKELNLDLMTLKREIKHLIKVLPHTPTFLRKLHDAKKQVLLVTNAHNDNLALKMERTQLHGYFHEIICSHDYGYSKEDRRFWQRFYEKHGFDGERTLMVDDNLDVLKAAGEFGVKHLMAIRKPDSQRPEKKVDDFPSVAGLNEIFPE